MKPFIVASVISLVAALSGAVPLANPQTTEAPAPTTTALVTSPSLPLSEYQLPVVLPNGVECIAPYLVMVMDKSKPDQPIPRIQQIGPNAFVVMEFNSLHAGKTCRFHFALSSLADGGNGKGSEDIYALKSGIVDENLTYNNQPVLEDNPVASFGMSKATVIGTPPRNEMYSRLSRVDFNCPTVKTGWAIRGKNSTLSNWSWNHGLIVEVSANGTWWEGGDKY